MALRRFIMNPTVQGGHEHHIEPMQHQVRPLAAWKKLSRQMVAKLTGKALRPNCVQELIEKYGECQAVLGSGTSGTVWISHKLTGSGRIPQAFAIKEIKRCNGETATENV